VPRMPVWPSDGGAPASVRGVRTRIARVERGVRPQAPLRSEPAAPVAVAELLARSGVPGASVAVIEGGRLAWTRGYV
jgi:hypothetical protein